MQTPEMQTPFIETYTGKLFHFLDPKPWELDIQDIAHALSNTCRYGGHCDKFYSVAEHSVYVSDLLPSEFKMQGLLHDASEAYLVDLPRPIKDYLPGYRQMEDQIMRVVANAWHFEWPMHPMVKAVDTLLLSEESFDLTKSQGTAFSWFPNRPGPIGLHIQCLPPEKAKDLFLERFEILWKDTLQKLSQAA